MSDHPIQGLMKTAMASIKDMVEVNTIVGDPVETPDGTVIIPISRVTFGFGAGGGGYEPDENEGDNEADGAGNSFGGGSGAGVSIRPVGFLVCSPSNGVRFMPVEGNMMYERLLDLVPQTLAKIQEMMTRKEDAQEHKDEGSNMPH